MAPRRRGRWQLRRVLVRRDRVRPVSPPACRCRFIGRHDGWCDAPRDRNYNRPVRLPYPASHERLWRDDHLYDIVVVLSHNERPRQRFGWQRRLPPYCRPAAASRPPAASRCRLADMRRLLALCGPDTVLRIDL